MAEAVDSLYSSAKAPPRAISGAAFWLGLAAAPSFAIMALITGVAGEARPEMLCSAMHGSVLSGMVPMYLLMSVFHAAPWLRLITTRMHR